MVRRRWLALSFMLACVATGRAESGDLNQRNRLDDGKLGLPLDRMFKAKPAPAPYEAEGARGEKSFLPPMIDFSPPSPPRRDAEERKPLTRPADPKPGARKAGTS